MTDLWPQFQKKYVLSLSYVIPNLVYGYVLGVARCNILFPGHCDLSSRMVCALLSNSFPHMCPITDPFLGGHLTHDCDRSGFFSSPEPKARR